MKEKVNLKKQNIFLNNNHKGFQTGICTKPAFLKHYSKYFKHEHKGQWTFNRYKKKAFDTVHRIILLKNIYNFWMWKVAYYWLKGYLAHRM